MPRVAASPAPQALIPTFQVAEYAPAKRTGRFDQIVSKAEVVIARIDRLLDDGYILQCACSFGKDSSVVLVLLLEAIRRRMEQGLSSPTAYVTHSNTGIENPAMDTYTEAMLVQLEHYCETNGLPVKIIQVKPSITSCFAYGTLGRGKLPVFVGAQRSCSVDWKLRPQQKAVKQLISTLQNPGELVTLLGTRTSESKSRGAMMRERGEEYGALVKTDSGIHICAVIADWEMEHVWELLMACEAKRGGPYRTFTPDFDWCLELYKEANEGTCAIITGDGGNKAACGSRFGCAWCTVTGERDKSMEAMIASAPEKHGHMEGVNKFRSYLINTRWDMSKRDWLGRTYCRTTNSINVTATAYNAEMRRDMLRYLLTLDVLEEERAEEHDARIHRGEIPADENQTLRGITFQFITAQKLVAIDFAWSLSYGFEHAFPALREWYEIRVLGKRYPIPSIAPVEKGTIPAVSWYQFDHWDTPANEAGLEDAYLESLNRDRHPERPASKVIKDRFAGKQRSIVYYEDADELQVDAIEANLFVDGFDHEFLTLALSLEPTDSAKFYLHRAMVKLAKGKAAAYDEMARRAQYWNRLERNLGATDLRAYVRHNALSDKKHSELLAAMEEKAKSASALGTTQDMFL